MLAPPQARHSGARRGGDPGGPSAVDSNASLALEVERNLHRDNDFSLLSAHTQKAGKGKSPEVRFTHDSDQWR
jgi:hypothetical protein